MRTWLIAGATFCVGLVGGFFVGRELPASRRPDEVTAPGAQTTAPKEALTYLSKEEVLDYLDGKAMALPGSSNTADKAELSCIFKRDQVEALEVEKGFVSINDGPRNTNVTFILNSDRGRYAVKCSVAYRRVENKCAFFGFDVRELGKQ